MFHFDLYPPISVMDSLDTISYSPVWVVSWHGADTNYHSGEGWGLRGFTIQWTTDSTTGIWHNWFTLTDREEAYFGPVAPVVVEDEHTYFFRVFAEDLNINVENYDEFDQYVFYKEPNLGFSIKNLEDGNDWSVPDTFDIGIDTIISPRQEDVLIVKNLSIIDSIDIGVRALGMALPNYLNWRLRDYPDTCVFSLRTIFNNSATPPSLAEFADPNNIVRDTFIVADETRFGPYGYGIAPVWMDSLSRTDNIWLELMLPRWTYVFGETSNVQIIMQFKARPVTH